MDVVLIVFVVVVVVVVIAVGFADLAPGHRAPSSNL
jgi:hypothetical protein